MSTQMVNCSNKVELSTPMLTSGCFDSDAELFENCAALGSALHCCELVVSNLPQFSEVYNVCLLHPVYRVECSSLCSFIGK